MGAYFESNYPHLCNEYAIGRQGIFQNPDHSMMKLGIIAESMTKEVILQYNFTLADNTQLCRLNTLQEYSLLPDDIATVFHDIRRLRNQASHEGYVNAQYVANLYSWIDTLIAWFENVMQARQPVYRRPARSTYGICGIPVEFFVYVGLPVLFFGSLIFSYVMGQIQKHIVPILLIVALCVLVAYRIRKKKWPFWIESIGAKVKSMLLRK